jgi:hypothetical protein
VTEAQPKELTAHHLNAKGGQAMAESDITVLSSQTRHPGPSNHTGGHTTSIPPGSQPHRAAIVDAVAADYCLVTGRPPVTTGHLAELAGRKVTLLRVGETTFGARAIAASPGTIVQRHSGRFELLPKGRRRPGYPIDAGRVLDVEPGYAGVAELRRQVAAVRATLPKLVPLSHDRLAVLPTRGRDCTLAVFGTWRLPGAVAPGVVWLLHSYLPSSDIVEGVLLARPDSGLGRPRSVRGQDLLGIGGEVLDAPSIAYHTAVALAAEDYFQVLAKFVHPHD